QREAEPGEAVAVEVVDEPPGARLALHEAQEGDQLCMAHVVRDEAGYDEIPAFARKPGIVASEIADRRIGACRALRDGLAARVEVDADQLGLDAALRGAARDPAQHVSLAEADIE